MTSKDELVRNFGRGEGLLKMFGKCHGLCAKTANYAPPGFRQHIYHLVWEPYLKRLLHANINLLATYLIYVQISCEIMAAILWPTNVLILITLIGGHFQTADCSGYDIILVLIIIIRMHNRIVIFPKVCKK